MNVVKENEADLIPSRAVQDVCGQIAAICRRLAEPWAAVAANMNLDADERENAAQNHSKLIGAASVVETYQGHADVERRLADIDGKLLRIASLARFNQQIELGGLSRDEVVVLHSELLHDLGVILG